MYENLPDQDFAFVTSYSNYNEYDTNEEYGCFPYILYHKL